MHEQPRLPAEWEEHAATWLAWPAEPEDWPGKLRPARIAFTEMARVLTRGEIVRVICGDKRQRRSARGLLDRAGVPAERLEFFVMPKDRGWLRDTLPFMVAGGEGLECVDFGFTAWARYENLHLDAKLGALVSEVLGVTPTAPKRFGRRVVLEGGAVDTNGSGTLITTEECLLGGTQVRNPGFTREDYEDVFREFLGIKKTLWLGRGVAGDDTGGHVDDCCRFVGESTVVACVEDDPSEANSEPLRENLELLRGMTTAEGEKIEVVELPMPEPVYWGGMRLPASYANFYVANGAVLVPTFNDPADAYVLGVFADLFPDRTVFGVHARDLVLGQGTIHCLTHEQPMI
jgi:agmatine deiminase